MTSAKSMGASVINGVLRRAGLELRSVGRPASTDPLRLKDLDPWVVDIIAAVRPFTMTSEERISALCHAVRYIARSNVPGDIVECGVWRGGSTMAAAMTLLSEGDKLRTLHLFDTFEGMPMPASVDRAADSGTSAADLLAKADRSSNLWAYAPIDDVQANLASTGYPSAGIRFIKGRVEDTIPREAPAEIAILRLDTDWYESTKHELLHLYPKLAIGGVLIIDDYGYWEGARKAVDEFIGENRLPILLQRIDDTGRIAVKTVPF